MKIKTTLLNPLFLPRSNCLQINSLSLPFAFNLFVRREMDLFGNTVLKRHLFLPTEKLVPEFLSSPESFKLEFCTGMFSVDSCELFYIFKFLLVVFIRLLLLNQFR